MSFRSCPPPRCLSRLCSGRSDPTVPGADPVPLVDGTGKKGWFEIPAVAQQAIIFQTRASEPKDGVLEFSN